MIKNFMKRLGIGLLAALLIVQTQQNFVRQADAGYVQMPTGTVLAFAGATAPQGYLFAFGQCVSRTTYAGLFAILGTTHGVCDGSTTFGLPDMRGRVIAGKDNMGGSAASRLTAGGSGITGTSLGAAGGSETVTLTDAQSGLPAHSHGLNDAGHSHNVNDPGHIHSVSESPHSHAVGFVGQGTIIGGNMQIGSTGNTVVITPGGSVSAGNSSSATTGLSVLGHSTGLTINANSTGISVQAVSAASAVSPHRTTQPTMVLNYIIKT